MNHPPAPCPTCARFQNGHCIEFDVAEPCVLYLERGSRAAQLAMRSEAQVLADLRRRYPEETGATPGMRNNQQR